MKKTGKQHKLALAMMGLVGLISAGNAVGAGGCFPLTAGIPFNPFAVPVPIYSLTASPSPVNQGEFSMLTLNIANNGGSGTCVGPGLGAELDVISTTWLTTTGTFFSGDGQQISVTAAPRGPVSVSFEYVNGGTFAPSFTGFLSYIYSNTFTTRNQQTGLQELTTTTRYGDSAIFSGSTSLNVIASPVPEPETTAMMLTGLGLLAFVARRRNRKV